MQTINIAQVNMHVCGGALAGDSVLPKNTMSLARAGTLTAPSGVKCTNYEAATPPKKE